MHRAVVVSLALFAAGCGIANMAGGISWRAKLDSIPTADCVRGAIAETDGVRLVDYKHVDKFQLVTPKKPVGMDSYYIDVAELAYASNVDIVISIGRYYSHQPVSFTLGYSAFEPIQPAAEAAARRLMSKIAARCGVPELEQRVRKQHWQEWEPYFFNV